MFVLGLGVPSQELGLWDVSFWIKSLVTPTQPVDLTWVRVGKCLPSTLGLTISPTPVGCVLPAWALVMK